MENKTPPTIEGKLDMILDYLREHLPENYTIGITQHFIQPELDWVKLQIKSCGNYKENNIFPILIQKLIDDKFIVQTTNKTINDGHQITVDGLLFEGYDTRRKRIKTRQQQTNIQNVAIAVGTGLSGLYVIGKVLLYLHQNICF